MEMDSCTIENKTKTRQKIFGSILYRARVNWWMYYEQPKKNYIHKRETNKTVEQQQRLFYTQWLITFENKYLNCLHSQTLRARNQKLSENVHYHSYPTPYPTPLYPKGIRCFTDCMVKLLKKWIVRKPYLVTSV